MNKLSFEHFIQIKEMAVGQFNWKGQPIGHLNDFNKIQINWVLDMMKKDPKFAQQRVFLADDGTGRLSADQVIDALKIRQTGAMLAPTSVGKPIKSMTFTVATKPKKAEEAPQSVIKKDSEAEKTEAPAEMEEPKSETNPHILDKETLSEEQKHIDEDFEKMMKGSGNHIMINALAGTGKTTILKHLAWKYGNSGQKWLYLVFNTKNRAEANESSGGWKKFPNWVEVYTTNSFLGHVLKQRENLGVIPATERMASLSKGSKGSKKFKEKSRIIADNPRFQAIMTDVYSIPEWEKVARRVPSILNKLGVREERSGRGQKDTFYEVCENTLKRTINGIRYNFQERSLTLLGLLKSFGVDPRNEDALRNETLKVFKKYDSHFDEKTGTSTEGYFDTHLEDIKERISKYKDRFKEIILNSLNEILGYDFMKKDYKNEIIEGTEWLLTKSLPQNTDEQHAHDNTSINLGDYRDFSDDIWFPTIYADKITWPKYDVILADEVQDFNEGQKIMIKKLIESGAKVVAVGDPNQCHPPGTVISLAGGEKKRIEEIEIGDQVVTYNTKKSYFPGTLSQGREVEKVASRNYSGQLIKIETETSSVRCTPNHKCLVKLNAKNKYSLYLMLKGQTARVGMCRVDYFSGFGLTVRAHQEQADKVWLLNIYATEKEARIAEIVTAAKFGLPQTVFKNNGQLFPSQDFINEVYESIGNNLEKVKDCLLSFGKDINFPIWNKEQKERFGKMKKNYIGSSKSFITQACNLISGFMQVRTFDGTNRGGKWEDIKISIEDYEGEVYSLKVEPTEDGKRLYVADGVVVHNSIYRFRGADSGAFNNLADTLKQSSKDKKDWKPKTLSLNFRSRPEVLDHVNNVTHVKDLKSGKKFKESDPEAEVTHEEVKYEDSFNQINQERSNGKFIETAYISRTNQPLVNAALQLLGNGTPFAIIGKDVSGDLTKHIKKIIESRGFGDSSSVQSFRDALVGHEEEEVERNSKFSTKKDYLSNLRDTTEALVNCVDMFLSDSGERKTIGMFKMWIDARLGSNTFDWEQSNEKESEDSLKAYQQKLKKEKPVILTTAHKSKGLEFSRVYILRNDQFPHPRAKHPEEMAQEENAKYVAYTRAMHQLHIIDPKSEPGGSAKSR